MKQSDIYDEWNKELYVMNKDKVVYAINETVLCDDRNKVLYV